MPASSISAADEQVDMPTEERPTIETVLVMDTVHCICAYINSIADLASLLQFWNLTNAERAEDPVRAAVRSRAQAILSAQAPLWCAASQFETVACCNGTLTAARKTRPFFASLCMPSACRVSGSGSCSHGLCQQEALPKPGVLDLLEGLLTPCQHTPAGEAESPAKVAVVLEAIAWLHGHCGRTAAALSAWARAARAGSARAQLDLGLHKYRTTGSASTLYSDPGRTSSADESSDPLSKTARAGAEEESAESWLLAASRNPSLALLGFEGHVIKARAMMTLGVMALDGDGSAQDDSAATDYLEGALRSVRAGSKAHFSLGAPLLPSTPSQAGNAADELLAADALYVQELGAVLQQVEEDARESMQAMGRFMFFANGRP